MYGSFSSPSAYPSGLGSRAYLLVFLLSSHWVRRFFIDRSLLVFLHSFLLRFGGFSSISEFRVFNHLPPQLTSTLTYYLLSHACRSSRLRGEAIVMTWTHDLLCDTAYSLHPSHQCDLILTKSTNSAYLFKHYYSQAYKARAYKDC